MFSLIRRSLGDGAARHRNGAEPPSTRRESRWAAAGVVVVVLALVAIVAVDHPVADAPPRDDARPRLAVESVFNVDAATETGLSINLIGRPEDVPPGTYVRIDGLPVGAMLSGGQPILGRGWMVPLRALENLNIDVPPDAFGTFDLVVALVDSQGVVLDRRAAELRVKTVAMAAQSAPEALAKPMPAALPSVDAPQARSKAVATSAQPVVAAAPKVRDKELSRTPTPHSQVHMVPPVPAVRKRAPVQPDPVQMAREDPPQSECLMDSRTPCNIGGGSGWWLWRAVGAVGRRVDSQ